MIAAVTIGGASLFFGVQEKRSIVMTWTICFVCYPLFNFYVVYSTLHLSEVEMEFDPDNTNKGQQ